MPGISGIVKNSTPIDNPTQILKTFENVHALNGVKLIQRSFQADHCVITNMLTGIIKSNVCQPACDPTGNTVLFLEGEIYNIDELVSHLSEPRDLSACGILLELFLAKGDDFVTLLNGDFNIVIYQKAENRLLILNDYLSTKPFFYMQQGDTLLFGSEGKAIFAAAPTTPAIDPLGILQVFAHRFYVDGRTFVEGYRRLPPASRLEFHNGQLTLTTYHKLEYKVDRSRSIEALIEEWGAYLRRAVVRRLKDKERLVISLSGGLDSRLLASVIAREFDTISAWTWGFKDSLEVMYASEIARRLNLNHIYREPTLVPLSDILHKVVWRTECAVIFSDCRSMPNHPIMKQHADFITGGWSADSSAGVIIHPYMLIPEPRGQFIDTTYHWYRRTSRFWLHKLFNQDFLRRTLPDLKDIFCGTFERLEADTNIQLYEIWNWYQRQARMTMSTGHVDSHLFEKVDPIRDRDYMNFTLTLPTRLRFDRSLYKAMIYEVAPELRDIPDASTDFTVGRTVTENLFKTCVSFGQLAHKKVLKTIGIHKQKRFMGDTAESLQVVTRQDPKLRGVVEDFVHSDYFDGTIFNKAGIMDVLDMHYRGAANFAYPLCYLATFAVGLPYFVYNRPDSCPPEAEPLQINTNGRVH